MQLHIAHKYIYNHLLRQNNDTPIPLLAQAHNFRFTKLGPTVLEAKIINVLSDEPCELWQAPSVSRNLVPQRPIFYQISQLVAIRDWYLPKFWCQPNGRRMSKFEIAICIPPDPASANFCPFQVLTAKLYKKRYRMIIKRSSQVLSVEKKKQLKF